MNILPIVLSSLSVLLTLVLVIYLLTRPKPRDSDPALNLMQQQLDALRQQLANSLGNQVTQMTQQLGEVNRQVTQQMSEVTRQLNQQLGSITQQFQGTTTAISQRLDKAAEVIGGVQKGLGELSGSAQRILDVGKDIAQLQEILRAPKLRGGLGELFLGDLLGQILPQDYYTLQHRFKTGEIVDAVVRLVSRMVPVDAKFPLENFRRLQSGQNDDERLASRKAFARDVKKHVDDIARKYILPDEGTFDFALMYIPAENVYYETIIKDDTCESESISDYARKRKVIPVSPNSFYAYLQAIVIGLHGFQIEKRASEIMGLLQRLKSDFERFKDDFETVGKHLVNAHNKFDEAGKRLVRFEDKLGGVGCAPVEGPAQPELPPG